MIKIAIILGSTRPNRVGPGVAQWVYEHAQKHSEASFELVDLKDYHLPLLDEPVPAAASSSYQHEHTKRWSRKIASFDAYVFVTAEYNHGIPGALKNALDFLYQEWNNKVAGIVGYGAVGGTRSVEQLRNVLANFKVATISTQMAFSLKTDFKDGRDFTPAPYHEKTIESFFTELIQWARALRPDSPREETVSVH